LKLHQIIFKKIIVLHYFMNLDLVYLKLQDLKQRKILGIFFFFVKDNFINAIEEYLIIFAMK